MDAMALYALTLLGGLALLAVSPFFHGPRMGSAWLLTGLVGGWVLINSRGRFPLEEFVLSATYVLQVMIGFGLLSRRLPSVVYGCLMVYAVVCGWYFLRVYEVDRWYSLVGSVVCLAWAMGWRRRFVL